MATTKKGKKKTTPKKTSKPKKNNKKNKSISLFGKFILILLLVAVLVSGILIVLKNINSSNRLSNDDKTEVVVKHTDTKTTSQQPIANSQQSKANSQQPTANSQQPTAKSQQPKANSQQPKANSQKLTANSQEFLSGSWLSTEQGASLTIDNYGYRIDFFGVDASEPIIGKIIIDDKNIIFNSDDGSCRNTEGKYKITFNKKDIRLICKDDECTKRRNVLEADWEWIEI